MSSSSFTASLLTLILQLQSLLHGARITRLERLHGRLVQLDDQLGKYVAGTRDAARLTRDERRKEVIAESRKNLEWTRTARVPRDVLGRLRMLSETMALADSGAGQFGAKAIWMLGELDEEIRVEVDSGCRTSCQQWNNSRVSEQRQLCLSAVCSRKL